MKYNTVINYKYTIIMILKHIINILEYTTVYPKTGESSDVLFGGGSGLKGFKSKGLEFRLGGVLG